jgi:uncharacterized protein
LCDCLAVVGIGFIRWVIGKALRLPPRLTSTVRLEAGIRTAMRDGVELVADRYHSPKFPDAPTVLMRSHYGRGTMFSFMAGLLVERGLQVFVQSVRGVSGSGGRFDPMRQERVDGADTVDWVRQQSWFNGQLFTYSMSYLGNVQYAVAMDRADVISGMGLGVTLSNFSDEFRSFGGLNMGGMLTWTQTMRTVMAAGERGKLKRPPDLSPVYNHLPLGTIDTAAFGEPVQHWQDWMAHDSPDDPFWRAMDYSAGVTNAKAPALMTAGWRDIFLPFQLKDFEARQAAGLPSWITIGPWTHAAPGNMIAGLKDAVIGFPAIAADTDPAPGRDKVRLFVEGVKEWRDYPSWPPPGGEEMRLHLHKGGRLGGAMPIGEERSSAYLYNPSDPTPAVHGPVLMGGKKLRDMAVLEARSDTLSFTAAPLKEDMEAIGPVSVNLLIRSDREHTDFYASLCEVDERGRSIQVCDGYIRLSPGKPEADESGIRSICLTCWPIAWRFKKGNALRVIIASGAHPRYARNLGTGEPAATATRMVLAQQEILTGGDTGSYLTLRHMPPLTEPTKIKEQQE